MLFLGAALTFLTIPVLWAQAVRVVRSQSVDGLAQRFVLLLLWSCITWVAQGIVHSNAAQIAAEVSCIGATTVMLVAFCRYGSASGRRIALQTAGFVALLGVAAFLGGRTGIAVFAVLMPLLSRVPQTIETVLRPGGHAVSVLSFSLAVGVEVLWILNGLHVGDAVTVGVSIYCGVHAAFVALRTATVRRRARVVVTASTTVAPDAQITVATNAALVGGNRRGAGSAGRFGENRNGSEASDRPTAATFV